MVAQAIAAFATARSATKRFKWEREQADRSMERDRDMRFLDDKREMYAKFLASHVEFRDALLMSRTADELSDAQQRLSAESEVARQVIVLVAPHMDRHLAGVYNEFRPAAVEQYAWLSSHEEKVKDPYFGKYGQAIQNCRIAMSGDLNG